MDVTWMISNGSLEGKKRCCQGSQGQEIPVRCHRDTGFNMRCKYLRIEAMDFV